MCSLDISWIIAKPFLSFFLLGADAGRRVTRLLLGHGPGILGVVGVKLDRGEQTTYVN